jgi:hypothetical protein
LSVRPLRNPERKEKGLEIEIVQRSSYQNPPFSGIDSDYENITNKFQAILMPVYVSLESFSFQFVAKVDLWFFPFQAGISPSQTFFSPSLETGTFKKK